MGRTLPTECEHGTIVDWGDFGPCIDGCEREHPEYVDDCPNFEVCPECVDDTNLQEFDLDYWVVTKAIGEAFDACGEGEEDSPQFWMLMDRLKKAYPQFDWVNATTDHIGRSRVG